MRINFPIIAINNLLFSRWIGIFFSRGIIMIAAIPYNVRNLRVSHDYHTHTHTHTHTRRRYWQILRFSNTRGGRDIGYWKWGERYRNKNWISHSVIWEPETLRISRESLLFFIETWTFFKKYFFNHFPLIITVMKRTIFKKWTSTKEKVIEQR